MEVKETKFERALTFDDVLLVPGRSKVLPKDVDVSTKITDSIKLNIPIISAAMDTVTESDMAIAMAREGGLGVIHRNLSIEDQVQEVTKVKHSEYWIVKNAITLTPEDTIQKVKELRKRTGYSGFPVLDESKLVGIITSRDLLFQDYGTKVKDVMTKDVITVSKEIDINEAKEILHKNKIEKLPVVDKEGNFKGLITVKDIKKKEKHPFATRDEQGRLRVAAAVSPVDEERIKALIEANVDIIVIDTAHGHSENVLNAVKKTKKEYGDKVQIIAGNVATAEATVDLIKAGADAIKVGIGGGAICTTRLISGVGVPQVTAINDASEAAKKHGIPVIADGGIRYSGDVTKAIAAGANCVMLGNALAGTEEAPGRDILMSGRKFKQYRGMGSVAAMMEGSKSRYFQSHVNDKQKLVPEGVEGVVPYKGKVREVLYQLIGGLKSGMGYCGTPTIDDLRQNGKFIKITNASLKESAPHSIRITNEAPNFSPEALY